MLRMAHQILSQQPRAMCACDISSVHRTLIGWHHKVVKSIPRSPVVVIDNVAQFYAEHKKDVWDIEDDFPSCVPYSPRLFVEFEVPTMLMNGVCKEPSLHLYGCLVETIDSDSGDRLQDIYEKDLAILVENANARWHVRITWYFLLKGQVVIVGACTAVSLSRTGSPIFPARVIVPDGPEPDMEFQNKISEMYAGCLLHIVLLAMSFANCKNVTAPVDRTEQLGPHAKWLRRKRLPTISYRVLEIDPMRETLRTEGGIERNGIKKALHICRGHFATYTEDKPLFGHTVGTVWKPAHVRGDIKQGAVVKDYSVGATDAVN